ncbi:MAG TPA: hypothetical protein VGM32_24200, partial [Rhodopila sp.]|jgi:hypothetical protein
MFRTLQDRLPKEMSLAGITTVEEANAWLRDTYIASHNARFEPPQVCRRLIGSNQAAILGCSNMA